MHGERGEEAAREAIEAVFRREAARVVGALTRAVGDFAIAEEAFQEAVVAALERWPVDGVPDRPGAWLTRVARNRAIDRLRRDAGLRARLPRLAQSAVRPRATDRLALVFTCCHPALAPDAQLALALRAVFGLTTAQVARAFLVTEAAAARRITRARTKISAAGVPLDLPDAAHLDDRLGAVLAALYLLYTEAHLATAGPDPLRADLADQAIALAGQLATWYPGQPEAAGLWVLMRLGRARAGARLGPDGRLLRLEEQDRTRWDRPAIEAAVRDLERAARRRRPGRYQIEAAIAACHAEAPSWEATDWRQILVLSHLLRARHDTPVVRLGEAVALSYVAGPAVALAAVDALAEELAGFPSLHAARADLLFRVGRRGEARDSARLAHAQTANAGRRLLLEARLRAWADGPS